MDLGKLKSKHGGKVSTAWDLAVAGSVCAIAHYGSGGLLDLNVVSYAEFIVNGAVPAWKLNRKGPKTKSNPLYWLGTGCNPDADIDVDALSPVTIEYLKHRQYKSIGGNIFAAVGLVASPHTLGANVLGAAKHGSAAATTAAHMIGLGCIAKYYAKDERAQGWIRRIEGMKAAKLGCRAAWTVANTVPGGGLPGTITAMVGSLAADKPMEVMCSAVAMDLHYAAQCEKTYAGRGPALDIIYELFTRRSQNYFLGKYNVDAIIDEPAGWMAVADKIRST